jgi:hypothetical protein
VKKIGILLLPLLWCCSSSKEEPLKQAIVKLFPAFISISAKEGEDIPPYLLEIRNEGNITLQWEALPTQNWLSTLPQRGEISPGEHQWVRIIFDLSGLLPGTYNASIEISGKEAIFPGKVDVKIDLDSFEGAEISLEEEYLEFTAIADGNAPSSQEVEITNLGGGQLEFYTFCSANWLSASPPFGVAPDNIEISCKIDGLKPGTYYGKVIIHSAQAKNSPQQIQVKLKMEPTSPAPEGRKWTILAYINGDNPLEEDAIKIINEMEMVEYPSDLTVLVQLDRNPGYDSSDNNWSGTRRYLLENDTDPSSINSQLLADLGELDMAEPETLRNFCLWGITNYPAQNYALLLWDGVVGGYIMGFDESSNNYMELSALKEALLDIQNTIEGFKFDLLIFCEHLLGAFEIFFEIRRYAKIAVALEDRPFKRGFNYSEILSGLVDDLQQGVSNYSLGVSFARGVSNSTTSEGDFAIIVANLENFSSLAYHLTELAELLQANMKKTSTCIHHTLSTLQKLRGAPFWRNQIDLGDFAYLLQGLSTNTQIRSSCENLLKALSQYTLYTGLDSFRNYPKLRGLSILFPPQKHTYLISWYRNQLSFAGSSWDEMILSYYSQLALDETKPLILDMTLDKQTLASGEDLSINVTFYDQEKIGRVEIFIAQKYNSYILPFGLEELPSPEAKKDYLGRTINVWESNLYSIQTSWKPIGWALSDGIDIFPVIPQLRDKRELTIKVLNEDQEELLMFFDYSTGELKDIFSNTSSAMKYRPEEGERITLISSPLQDENTTLQIGSFCYSSQRELFLARRIPPEGEYLIGIRVKDLSNNIEISSRDLRIK